MRYIPKPKSVMGDYIASHWDEPKNQLPKNQRHIPKGEVWVRTDWYNNPKKLKDVKTHEGVEIHLMRDKGLRYKQAHAVAKKFEHHRFR